MEDLEQMVWGKLYVIVQWIVTTYDKCILFLHGMTIASFHENSLGVSVLSQLGKLLLDLPLVLWLISSHGVAAQSS